MHLLFTAHYIAVRNHMEYVLSIVTKQMLPTMTSCVFSKWDSSDFAYLWFPWAPNTFVFDAFSKDADGVGYKACVLFYFRILHLCFYLPVALSVCFISCFTVFMINRILLMKQIYVIDMFWYLFLFVKWKKGY